MGEFVSLDRLVVVFTGDLVAHHDPLMCQFLQGTCSHFETGFCSAGQIIQPQSLLDTCAAHQCTQQAAYQWLFLVGKTRYRLIQVIAQDCFRPSKVIEELPGDLLASFPIYQCAVEPVADDLKLRRCDPPIAAGVEIIEQELDQGRFPLNTKCQGRLLDRLPRSFPSETLKPETNIQQAGKVALNTLHFPQEILPHHKQQP